MYYLESELDYVAHLVKISKSIVVSTGAGASAESGIDTFRGDANSIWSKYKVEDVATPSAFRKDPEFVVDWYCAKMEQMNSCDPNAGHYAIAELEKYCDRENKGFNHVTQNIDGLHTRAGVKNSVEVHGNIHIWYCPVCKEISEHVGKSKCRCDVYFRPDVVWFGEMLHGLNEATTAIEDCDLFFSIGTSANVEPAASFLRWAHMSGAKTVEINLGETYNSDLATISLREKFGDVMPIIIEKIGE